MSDHLITVQIHLTGDVYVDVTGEPTSNPNLAITPRVVVNTETGDLRLEPHLVLTHIPTGLAIGSPVDRSTVWGAPVREAVDRIASMADWSTKPTNEEAQAIHKACIDIRAEHDENDFGVIVHA